MPTPAPNAKEPTGAQTVSGPLRNVLSGAQRPPVDDGLLELLLSSYCDKDFVVNGLHYGFKLGFTGPATSTYGSNGPSISDNPAEAASKLNKEVELGRIASPFATRPFKPFKCSPISLRPKPNGKFRLLHDLSFPYNEHAVNHNIPDSAAEVSYPSIKSAISIINSFDSPPLAQ